MNSKTTIQFSVGDLKLCVAASSVHCIHDGLIAQQEPDTQPWFAGIAVVEGRLLPVTDLGIYLGQKSSHGRVIEVAHNLGIAGLRVDDILSVNGEQDETQHEFLDLAELVQSDRFLTIQSEPA